MNTGGTSSNIVPLRIGRYNLLKVYAQSKPWEHEQGRVYWEQLRNRIHRYAPTVPIQTAVAVFTVLSPNNSEKSNLRDMQAAIAAFKNKTWDELKVTTYGANKAKALEILEGVDPLEVIRGPKTLAMYQTLLEPGPKAPPVIDGHMMSAWQGQRLTLDEAGINKTEYKLITIGASEVAHYVGLQPCQLQAVIWMTWKRLHNILYDPQLKLGFEE